MVDKRTVQGWWTLAALFAATGAVSAQAPAADPAPPVIAFTVGKTFMFLFLTLGPLKIIGPFTTMTRGRDTAFKRNLAFEGSVIAAIAVAVCAGIGSAVLRNWNISIGALLLTAGVILFLVALRPALREYEATAPTANPVPAAPAGTVSAMAFSPLAFPTIVPPYGIAVLIMMVALAEGDLDKISRVLGIAAAVLVMDFAVMLVADRILDMPLGRPALGIVGAVMGVLQIALGIQAIVTGLRMLRVVASPT